MHRRTLWFAVTFAAVPTLIFACGGRSDIDLLLADDSPDGGVKAGAAGTAGKAGSAGAGNAAGTAAGHAGSGNAAGKTTTACIPGQQVDCPCPGTDIPGIQVCAKDGQSLSACTGCPPPGTAGGGAGASGAAGTAGKSGGAGTAGKAGSGGTAGTAGKGGSSAAGGSTGQGGTAGSAGKPQDPPDGGDFFDSFPFPLPDSGPVGTCVNCLQSQCGDAINGCYNDPSCTQGIQCAITTCFAGGMGGNPIGGGNMMGGNPLGGLGGGVNFGCLLGCFNGDVGAVFAAVQTFQCITQTCGGDCGGGLLGDGGGFPLGGLGGGGAFGGLGGGQPGGSQSPEAQLMSGVRYIDGVRVPLPAEVPGYPWLQEALTPPTK